MRSVLLVKKGECQSLNSSSASPPLKASSLKQISCRVSTSFLQTQACTFLWENTGWSGNEERTFFSLSSGFLCFMLCEQQTTPLLCWEAFCFLARPETWLIHKNNHNGCQELNFLMPGRMVPTMIKLFWFLASPWWGPWGVSFAKSSHPNIKLFLTKIALYCTCCFVVYLRKKKKKHSTR